MRAGSARRAPISALAKRADDALRRLGPSVQIRTLNYAPGPLDTDMQADIRESANMDPQSRDAFRQLHAEVRARRAVRGLNGDTRLCCPP